MAAQDTLLRDNASQRYCKVTNLSQQTKSFHLFFFATLAASVSTKKSIVLEKTWEIFSKTMDIFRKTIDIFRKTWEKMVRG